MEINAHGKVWSDVAIVARGTSLVLHSQTILFCFYLWWQKKGSGLVHTHISS